jgi:hypothetical protein
MSTGGEKKYAGAHETLRNLRQTRRRQAVRRLQLPARPRLNKTLFGDKVKGVYGPDERRPLGILELYVCLKCGFSEWYARNPASIPVGPEFGTEKVVAQG